MRHISALIVKFIMTAIILEIALLLLSRLSFGNILWVSLVVTAISYLIGDMVILPAINNLVATLADMVISFVVIYMFNFFWNTNDIPFLSALVAGVALGAGEFFFHKLIDRKINDDDFDALT
ncbi:MAG TPA: DUF2512 family protein [Mobilitalea sp.]|nr:DUF2512 family protein [Mobilitalea sp.]